MLKCVEEDDEDLKHLLRDAKKAPDLHLNEPSFFQLLLKHSELNLTPQQIFLRLKYDVEHNELIQAAYKVFKQVMWPVWWLLGGFLPPGAVMFLGLFVLKSPLFETAFAKWTFLGASALLAVTNVIVNWYRNARDDVFGQLESDLAFLEKMYQELDQYLIERAQAQAYVEQHGNDDSDALAKLGVDVDDPTRVNYERALFFAIHSANFAIEQMNQLGHSQLNHGAWKALSVIDAAHEVITKFLMGFGFPIFIMMTLSIWWTMPLPLIFGVIAVAIFAGTIWAGMTLNDIFTNQNDVDPTLEPHQQLEDRVFMGTQKRLVRHVDERTDAIKDKLRELTSVAPEAEVSLNEKAEFYVDKGKETPKGEPRYLLHEGKAADFARIDVYSPKFVHNLKEIADRGMQVKPDHFESFKEYDHGAAFIGIYT